MLLFRLLEEWSDGSYFYFHGLLTFGSTGDTSTKGPDTLSTNNSPIAAGTCAERKRHTLPWQETIISSCRGCSQQGSLARPACS